MPSCASPTWTTRTPRRRVVDDVDGGRLAVRDRGDGRGRHVEGPLGRRQVDFRGAEHARQQPAVGVRKPHFDRHRAGAGIERHVQRRHDTLEDDPRVGGDLGANRHAATQLPGVGLGHLQLELDRLNPHDRDDLR